MKTVVKRDGMHVIFDSSKIRKAIENAAKALSIEFVDVIEVSPINLTEKAKKNYDIAAHKFKVALNKLAFKVKPNYQKMKSFLKRLYSRLKPTVDFLKFLKDVYGLYEFIKDFLPDKPSSKQINMPWFYARAFVLKT